jgi:hypothetical protein
MWHGLLRELLTQTRSRKGRMTTGKGPEAIVHDRFVRIRAYCRSDKYETLLGVGKSSDSIIGKVGEVWLASRK